MAFYIKRQDRVRIIAGKSKNQEGIVLQVFRKENKVIVQGQNKGIKHQKPTAQEQSGGRIEREMPIHISNVRVISPKSGQPVRLARKEINGKRVRVEAKTGVAID